MKLRALESKDYDTSSLLVTSSRHRDGLQKAKEHVQHTLDALDQGLTGDFLSIDLRAALNELGTITGEITNEHRSEERRVGKECRAGRATERVRGQARAEW